jgi:hypothetical protein
MCKKDAEGGSRRKMEKVGRSKTNKNGAVGVGQNIGE